MFPPIPPWEGMHVLLIHFPIALLMVAPLFVLAGLVACKWRTPVFASALALMLLGTIGVYVAVATGEAAKHAMERTRENSIVVSEHEELAEKARLVFTILTLVFAAITIVPPILAKKGKTVHRAVVPVATLAFLAVYAWSQLLLANTAHLGGLLVHEYGVRAVLEKRTDAVPPDAVPTPAIQSGEDISPWD